MQRSRVAAFLLTVILTSVLGACQMPPTDQSEPEKAETSEEMSEGEAVEREPPPAKRVTLAATGDIMVHSTQIKAARQHDGSYDFNSVFTDIQPYLEAADLTFANLETTFGGSEPYTGYPLFNAPDAMADALKNAGFDIIQTANNHTMDSKAKGAVRTYNVLREKGLSPVGTAASPEDRKPLIVEKNGIKLAFLAYTYGTNGIPVPEDQPYLVNLIDEDVIAQDIQQSKEDGAEFIIVGLHFGNEFEREPNEEQRQLVNRVFEMGADVILGGHPHVLQPMEQMEVGGEKKFVIYSLGNFVSNQFSYTVSNPYANKGVILYLDIEKHAENETAALKEVRFLPTVVHRYEQNGIGYTILPIEEKHVTSESLPYEYPGLTFNMVQEAWEQTTAHMEQYESFPVFHLEEAD